MRSKGANLPRANASAPRAKPKQRTHRSHGHHELRFQIVFGIAGYRYGSVTGNPLSGVIICPAQKRGGQRLKVNSVTCQSSSPFYASLRGYVNITGVTAGAEASAQSGSVGLMVQSGFIRLGAKPGALPFYECFPGGIGGMVISLQDVPRRSGCFHRGL
jgi:hypothetical protein